MPLEITEYKGKYYVSVKCGSYSCTGCAFDTEDSECSEEIECLTNNIWLEVGLRASSKPGIMRVDLLNIRAYFAERRMPFYPCEHCYITGTCQVSLSSRRNCYELYVHYPVQEKNINGLIPYCL